MHIARAAQRAWGRARSRGAFFGNQVAAGNYGVAWGTVQAPMMNGAIKGAMIGAGLNASMSIIGDASNGNLGFGSVGRAFGAGIRGGVMGGAVGAAGGVGMAFGGPGRFNRPRAARMSPGSFIRPGGVSMAGGVNLMNRRPRPGMMDRMRGGMANARARAARVFDRGARPGTRGRL